ncbi:MAG: PH domain-containing protein [Longimicrobiales bacterium]
MRTETRVTSDAPRQDPSGVERLHWVSKKDPLIVAAVGLGVLGCVAIGGWIATLERGGLLPALGIALSGMLPLALFLPVRYSLDAEMLRVRSGLFRWRIPLPLIVEVRPAGRGVGPALSSHRLDVRFRAPGGHERVLISPRERADFLRALRRVAPHVVIMA